MFNGLFAVFFVLRHARVWQVLTPWVATVDSFRNLMKILVCKENPVSLRCGWGSETWKFGMKQVEKGQISTIRRHGKLMFLALTLHQGGEQGWHSGDCTCLPPTWPGFDLGLVAMSRLRWLLVLYSAARGFSPDSLVFPSPQKSTFPNSNSIGCRTSLENTFKWVELHGWISLIIIIITISSDKGG